ncbi:hypothetical protein NPS01_22510 [Nocardioides psychrotolerans]|uniref:Uncharacterized protein n=1 Tax=Nocardioides psychrotolerans TaxID=1005945 RepID=A0A1I3I689_9ACTN|nr:hypothetical protein [Nocardioides psychrotolerans]GEP38588.1 hypothetical protein NPS01_22510 [Nocardioides psychrotolerans]SFI43432.1 hypothetical protein SAMN05216561_108133 [Nocardioides psychrotolerans]
MSETERTTRAPKSATPSTISLGGVDHELCGAEHPSEAVTCALVKNPWRHDRHVGHRDGDEPLPKRTITWPATRVDPATVDEGDAIRVPRPDGLGEEQWATLRETIRSGIDDLVAQVKQTPCTPWCERHQDPDGDGGWCATRVVDVDGADIAVTTGTRSGQPYLYGLSQLEEGIELGSARHLADTIQELLGTVEGAPAAAVMASHTWRDLAAEASLLRDVRLYDAARPRIPFASKDLRQACMADHEIGGLLAWNSTTDDEGGSLVMFAGQSAAQERRVMENAGWMVSCGAVYAAERVGVKGYKLQPDARVTEGTNEFLVWLLPNGADVEGMLR